MRGKIFITFKTFFLNIVIAVDFFAIFRKSIKKLLPESLEKDNLCIENGKNFNTNQLLKFWEQ